METRNKLVFEIRSQALAVQARLKGPNHGRRKALCGREHPCPGSLGILVPAADPDDLVSLADTQVGSVAEHEGRSLPSAWFLQHDNGYRCREDGRYEVLKDKRPVVNGRRVGYRRGRRDLPFAQGETRSRDIVGQFPEPPVTIVCPVCKCTNVVSEP